ncbi:putative nucleic acid-binding protein [Psychroflexus sp. MBR-150]|jgi:predicted nucleic acid-binding protein
MNDKIFINTNVWVYLFSEDKGIHWDDLDEDVSVERLLG